VSCPTFPDHSADNYRNDSLEANSVLGLVDVSMCKRLKRGKRTLGPKVSQIIFNIAYETNMRASKVNE